MRALMSSLAHLRSDLLHWLGLSILLGHEETPQVLIDNLGRQLNSIILICRAKQAEALYTLLFPSSCTVARKVASIEPDCADMRLLQSQHLTDGAKTPEWHSAQALACITKPCIICKVLLHPQRTLIRSVVETRML